MKQWALALLLWCAAAGGAQEGLTLFQPGSYQVILQQHPGRPFILVFWSLECSHCQGELRMLGELLAARPQLELVVVSTDAPSDETELRQVLASRGLDRADGWVFAEADSARLRYEIDRSWYGELPRSYLFDAQHNRRVHSGVLKRGDVERWLETIEKGEN